MKNWLIKIIMMAFGVGIFSLGCYYLKYYFDKQDFIKQNGKAAWVADERVYGTAKNKLLSTLLYKTWWFPAFCVVFGGFIVYAGLTEKNDSE
jgi:hypothetical protein